MWLGSFRVYLGIAAVQYCHRVKHALKVPMRGSWLSAFLTMHLIVERAFSF
jgi:hypothetical protein